MHEWIVNTNLARLYVYTCTMYDKVNRDKKCLPMRIPVYTRGHEKLLNQHTIGHTLKEMKRVRSAVKTPDLQRKPLPPPVSFPNPPKAKAHPSCLVCQGNPQDCSHYPITSTPPGICLIINNIHFSHSCHREGSAKDSSDLTKSMGYSPRH